MSKVNSFTYELLTPVPYALKGEQADGTFIELSAPTSREMAHVTALKQMFYRALPKDGEQSDEEDAGTDNLTGETIMALIYTSEVDAHKLLLTAVELFKTVGLIEGETKLTKPIIDAIDLDDLEKMTGEYMLNFILASVLQNQK